MSRTIRSVPSPIYAKRAEVADRVKNGNGSVGSSDIFGLLEGDNFVDVVYDAYANKVQITLNQDYQSHIIELDEEATEGDLDDDQFEILAGSLISPINVIKRNEDYYYFMCEDATKVEYFHTSKKNDGTAYISSIIVYRDEMEGNYKQWKKVDINCGVKLYSHIIGSDKYAKFHIISTTDEAQDIEESGDITLLADFINSSPTVVSVALYSDTLNYGRVLYVNVSGSALAVHMVNGTDTVIPLEPTIYDEVNPL